MYFDFVGVERFDDRNFDWEVVIEEVVESGRRLRHTEDFVWLSRC